MESYNLYHVLSTYHLLFSAEYSRLKHKEERNILLVSNTLLVPVPNILKLKDYFSEIVVFNYFFPRDRVDDISACSREYFDDIFCKARLDIRDAKEIYVCNPSDYFGVYLASNKIPFTFVEDAAGLVSNPTLLQLVHDNYPVKKYYCSYYNLYDATNSIIKGVIGNKNAQLYDVPHLEHFDVVHAFELLDENDQQSIRSVFGVNNCIESEVDAVILTEHLANQDLMSYEEQMNIYQIMKDFFLAKSRIGIKPHPNDLCYYEELFPDQMVIRMKFPSEILPSVFSIKPRLIATITSTGIKNIGDVFEDKLILGLDYRNHYISTLRYYVALCIIASISNECEYEELGTVAELVPNLRKYGDIPIGSQLKTQERIIIIDSVDEDERNGVFEIIETVKEDDVIVFINGNERFCFYDYDRKEIWDDIIPVTINKSQLRNEDFYSDTETETIYFYTKSSGIRRDIEMYSLEKNLEYTGMKVTVYENSEQEQRIKVLEGLLAATEKRLLYYIEKENANKDQQ